MSDKDNKVTILDDEKGLVLNHEYDGIKELNNPLPAWWSWIFILSVVFSVVYFYYYHMMEGHSLQAEYQAGIAKIEQTKIVEKKVEVGFSDEAFAQASSDATTIEFASGVFKGKCAVCHGPEGQGGIGPNLTDKFWLNSDGTPKGIHKTISGGVLTKGMPAWKDIISAKEVMALTLFVTKMKGTTPKNPKMPQGQEYP
jgi:cytochrome c oxidase cbb3-type subunit III